MKNKLFICALIGIFFCSCQKEEKDYKTFRVYYNGGTLWYGPDDLIQIDTIQCIPVEFRPENLGPVGLVNTNVGMPFNYLINTNKYDKVRIEWDWEVEYDKKRIVVFQFKNENSKQWETFSINSKGTYTIEEKKILNFRVLVEASEAKRFLYFKIREFHMYVNNALW